MGAFQYVAVDPRGKEHSGVLEGDTARHVRQLLRDRELTPVKVDEVESRERKRIRSVSLRRGVSALDLAIVTRQLATLVQAGVDDAFRGRVFSLYDVIFNVAFVAAAAVAAVVLPTTVP